MSGLLSTLALVVTALLGWVSDTCSTIVSEPFLLLTVGFLVLGGTIGIIGRLLSRN